MHKITRHVGGPAPAAVAVARPGCRVRASCVLASPRSARGFCVDPIIFLECHGVRPEPDCVDLECLTIASVQIKQSKARPY